MVPTSVDALRGLPFFENMDASQVNLLAAMAKEVGFEKDQIIFREGEAANQFYIVLTGKVALELTTSRGRSRVLTVEEYVVRTEPFFEKDAFFESEVARRVEQWGHLAHVFSTYESRRGKGEKPFMRGINSIQLMNDGQRWWVVSILWDPERPDQPLPEKYLKR